MNSILYVKNRAEWRAWLRKNHGKEKEIWLVYSKKHSGEPGIKYDDAVEEAICYGWIDSTVRKLDEERFMQRYTPRNPKSLWSVSNIKRAKKMIRQKKMAKPGLEKFRVAKKEKIIPKQLPFPDDLKEALKENKKAWSNFSRFAPSYKKLYFFWILDAKKDETRLRRIKKAVESAEKNSKYPAG